MGKWDRYAEEFNNSAMGRYAAWKADTAGTVKSVTNLTTVVDDNNNGQTGRVIVENHRRSTAHRPLPTTAWQFEPANDNYPRVIALSGVAGSGKSTASAFLQFKGYKLEKFAGPLKDMLRSIGLGEMEIEGQFKEKPNPLLGEHTPRHAMQTLGTEWGRKCMGEDFWINLWRSRASNGNVVVDDCRFANEAAAVRSLGGIVIRLEGRGGIEGGHESERLDFIVDAVVPNTGSVAQLHALLDETLMGWGA